MVTHLSHDPRLPKPKRAKYRNKLTIVDGLRFHSLGEGNRWRQLRLMERAKSILNLRRQVRYALHVNGELIGSYIADFVYTRDLQSTGWTVIEDFKGFDTPLSRWKRKHVKAQYGIEVSIIKDRIA